MQAASPHCRIRRAEPRDLPTVYEFERAYIDEVEPDNMRAWQNALALHRAQWAANLPRMFVAMRGETAIGHCFWQVDGPSAVLASLYVTPTHRRKGYGSRLLQCFENDAEQQGFAVLTLSVRTGNPAASFYHRAGYQAARTENGWRRCIKTAQHEA